MTAQVAPWVGIGYFQVLAHYNRWANERLYDACVQIDEGTYNENLCAYFNSIGGTLNHIMAADDLWLERLEERQPSENSPPFVFDKIIHANRNDLRVARQEKDEVIINLLQSFDDSRLAKMLHYKDTEGHDTSIAMPVALGHFFNHQTHHRGQVHTMLSQVGKEPPALDLSYFYQAMTL